MERTGPDPASRNTHMFATERLLVDLPTQDDAADLFQLVGGPDRRAVCATLVWDGPEHVAEVAGWIARCRHDTFADYGFHWVVRDLDGSLAGTAGEALGAIGTRPTGIAGRGDVGYWLGRPYWGNGIMGEALTGLLEYGFDALDYYRMEAEVYANNPRGRRLVESRGMRYEGTVRHGVRKYGEFVDVALYGLLAEEWAERR